MKKLILRNAPEGVNISLIFPYCASFSSALK